MKQYIFFKQIRDYMKITTTKTTYVKQPQTHKPISHSLFSLLRTCFISFLFFTSKVNSHEVLPSNYIENHNGRLFGVVLAPGEPSYCYKGFCLSSKPYTYVCYTIHDVGTSINVKFSENYNKETGPCKYI